MDNITKGVEELLTEDSGSSQENKVDEPSQGDSQTSTDTGETPETNEVAKHSITTRSSKKVSLQRKDNSFSTSTSSTAMDISEETSADFVGGGHSISTRSCKRRGAAMMKHNQTMKFMENFDPEHSNRERKKLTRQITSSGKRKPTLYDEKGVMISAEVDLCDCLDSDCPGCHFPCPKCHSNKCGHECRQNRRWTYEEIWVEGTNKIVNNPLIGIK